MIAARVACAGMGEKMTRRQWLIHRIVMAGGDANEAAEIVADIAIGNPEADYDRSKRTVGEWEALPAWPSRRRRWSRWLRPLAA